MGQKQARQGAVAEELLRSYFLGLGYFVVRGAKVRFASEDVTDIDLWLYARPSPLSRERVNVDAKFKRREARALERVLWTKGLQRSLGLDRCIVATTDQRELVKEYGQELGVLVLDGAFWARLKNSVAEDEGRLSEEELLGSLRLGRDDRVARTLIKRLEHGKSLLVTRLDFDACNHYLEEMREFLVDVLASSSTSTVRLFYLYCSYFLVALDYIYRRFAFEDLGRRRDILAEGFRHGTQGKARTESIVSLAERLIAAGSPERRSLGPQLRLNIFDELAALPVDILAEFFANQRVAADLLPMARVFERYAYGGELKHPDELEPNLKAVVGVTLDFVGVSRPQFFSLKWRDGSVGAAAELRASRANEP